MIGLINFTIIVISHKKINLKRNFIPPFFQNIWKTEKPNVLNNRFYDFLNEFFANIPFVTQIVFETMQIFMFNSDALL